MAGRNVETKIIFKGEDQVTSVNEAIERGTDKIYESLFKTGKLPFMDLSFWERLKAKITGVSREAEKLRTASDPGQWTGRAAQVLRRGALRESDPRGEGYQRILRQMTDLEPLPEPETKRERDKRIKREGQNVPDKPVRPRRGRGGEGLSWANFLSQGAGVPQALSMAGGGVGGFAGGLGMLGRAVAGVPVAGWLAAGGLAAVAGGAMMANRLAQPAFDILGMQAPLTIRHGAAAERAIREQGARVGMMPQQALQAFLQLERFGGQAGFRPLTQMRGLGIEPEMAGGLFQAATAGGGVMGRTQGEYERLAKLIAVAIADKTKLPSVPQYLEQMTSLLQLNAQYTGDIRESGTEQIAAIAKWQEESGSSLLRGTRGAQTMASISNWVSRSEDPAQQAMIYQILKGSPTFMGAAQKRFGELGLNFGPGQEYQQFAFMRTNPMAAITALGGARKYFGGSRAMAAIAMAPAWNMTPEQALTLQDVAARTPGGGKPEEYVARVAEQFKKETGVNLEAMLSGTEPIQLQRTLAETANKQLTQAMELAKEVAIMRSKMVELVDVAMPALQVTSHIANGLLTVISGGIKFLTNWGDDRTPEERQQQYDYARNMASGNPSLKAVGQGKVPWARKD